MKVVIESSGTLTGSKLTGVALTPSVSLNHNIYSVEALDNAKGLGVPLVADWEHTDENIGSVTYSKGPNHSILYEINVTSPRKNEIKEGLHRVSIEAEVDEVVSSCNKKGCYNLLDGITLTGIGVTENPGVQTTTLNIIESFQEWPKIEGKHCVKCEEKETIPPKNITNTTSTINFTGTANPFTTTGGSYTITTPTFYTNESEELKKKIEGLEKEIEILKLPKCEHCGKVKKN